MKSLDDWLTLTIQVKKNYYRDDLPQKQVISTESLSMSKYLFSMNRQVINFSKY